MSFLRMSLAGGVMILAVLLLRTLAGGRLPRRTFPIFWDLVLLRLLVPFTLHSPTSAYTVIERRISPVLPAGSPSAAAPVLPASPLTSAPAGPTASPFPVWPLVWGIGFAVCVGIFAAAWLRCRREFRTALPVEQPWADTWLRSHPLRRRVTLRQSDRTGTPLTYGVLRPVILLPRSLDWSDPEALAGVFAHEWVHIRRFDSAVKPVLAAAVCLHWFNPLVWCMYVLANRDLELACDEAAVRLLGPERRAAYARTLLSMEEARSGVPSLYSSFSKSNLEKRILAIMKWKKATLPAVLAAVLLVTGVAAAFATSPDRALEPVPDTSFTEEEYAWLSTLRFDGYEQMTAADFQNRVWSLVDTPEAMALLERFSQDETLYRLRDSSETAGFLFYVLDPLTAEHWQVRSFDGAIQADAGDGQALLLEYILTETVTDPAQVTVGVYGCARTDLIKALQHFLDRQTPEALRSGDFADTLAAQCRELESSCGSRHLTLHLDYVLQLPEDLPSPDTGALPNGEAEPREFPNGTAEDYRSLLALKTPEFQSLSVREFNQRLLDWADEDYERMERVNIDIALNNFQVELTEEELAFLQWTVRLSGTENGKFVQSAYTGRPAEDPWYGSAQMEKAEADGTWCSLWYQFSYHIADRDALTVGERDRAVSSFVQAVRDHFYETPLEELVRQTESDTALRMQRLAGECSSDLLTISTDAGQIQFEHDVPPPDQP